MTGNLGLISYMFYSRLVNVCFVLAVSQLGIQRWLCPVPTAKLNDPTVAILFENSRRFSKRDKIDNPGRL
jgi:hypothetical protein